MGCSFIDLSHWRRYRWGFFSEQAVGVYDSEEKCIMSKAIICTLHQMVRSCSTQLKDERCIWVEKLVGKKPDASGVIDGKMDSK
jgi:hypothetical protein